MSSFSINRVVLIGRLARDPDLRSLPSGTSLCELRVVCSSARKDAGSGEYLERPNFFDVNAYAGAAESAGRYLRKGNRVAIDGRLQWREWETADGQRRQTVRIVADTMLFLDGSGGRRNDRQTSSRNETARVPGLRSDGDGHADGDQRGHGSHPDGVGHEDPSGGESARGGVTSARDGGESARGGGESARGRVKPAPLDESDGSSLNTDVDLDAELAVGSDADTATGPDTDTGPVRGMELVF
jgi:single-strand DNA-binding protein